MKRALQRNLCAALLVAALGAATSRGAELVREEFHHTYKLTEKGRFSLKNVNGDVHITGWDKNEVQVDAVKRAENEADLAEIKIEVEAKDDQLEIITKYPKEFWKRHHSDKSQVEYTVRVPRQAVLKGIDTVNGGLTLREISGELEAHTVNGSLLAEKIGGAAQISTVNGSVKCEVSELTGDVTVHSVNGSVTLDLPAKTSARLRANSVNGRISGDIANESHHHSIVGHQFEATVGGGDRKVTVSTVNGAISFNQSKAVAQVKP